MAKSIGDISSCWDCLYIRRAFHSDAKGVRELNDFFIFILALITI